MPGKPAPWEQRRENIARMIRISDPKMADAICTAGLRGLPLPLEVSAQFILNELEEVTADYEASLHEPNEDLFARGVQVLHYLTGCYLRGEQPPQDPGLGLPEWTGRQMVRDWVQSLSESYIAEDKRALR